MKDSRTRQMPKPTTTKMTVAATDKVLFGKKLFGGDIV